MSEHANADDAFSRNFTANAANLPGAGAPWLDMRRARATKTLRAGGVPHRRMEAWKYTDLRGALDIDRARLEDTETSRAAGQDRFTGIAGTRLTLIDGILRAQQPQSPPDGVELFDLASLYEGAPDWVRQNFGRLATGASMAAASFALMRGGVALRVAREMEAPIHLEFSGQGAQAANHARILIVLEKNASLTLLETHARGGSELTNIGVEIALAENARLEHVRLAEESPNSIQVEEIEAELARDSRYRACFLQRGARIARVELAIALAGEGAEAALSGASILGGKVHADVTTHIDHRLAKTASRQLFKNVAGGHSRAVYQGKITVREGANGSDSRQTAKALLLGASAEVDLKPELEILADDVKCAHGVAVGALDAESLFYLRSRGLPEAEARALLMRAFLDEALGEIEGDDIRSAAWDFVEQGLASATQEPA